MADTKQATHGFKPSIHAKTCPEFHQKANAENDGCVQDSAFPCNCGADKFAASRSGPDRTPADNTTTSTAEDRNLARSTDESRSEDGVTATQIGTGNPIAAQLVGGGPDRTTQDAPELGDCDGHFDLCGSRHIYGRPHIQNAHCTNWRPAKAAREGQAPKGDRVKVEREPGCKCEYAIWTNAKGCPVHDVPGKSSDSEKQG